MTRSHVHFDPDRERDDVTPPPSEAAHALNLFERLRNRARPGDGDRLFGSDLSTPLSHHDETDINSAAEAIAVGTPSRIGRFRIIRRLGEGGFGVVFLASDPQLNRPVALKVPGPGVLMKTNLLRRFLREGEAAASLDHPHIVPVFEAGRVGAVHYIASAFVEGMPLSEWLAGHARPLDNRSAARLVAVLAGAVQHAHSRGVLHRDLKPSNVLLEQPSTNATTDLEPSRLADMARLTDFGLAKLLASEPRAGDTQTQAILGTPAYMSPEQAEGRNRDVGTPADVYALGAILYELLTGEPPFQRDSHLATLKAVCSEEPTPPSKRIHGISADLEAICLKCLEKNSVRRYSTANLLTLDLKRYLNGDPIQARPIGPMTRAWRWSRKHPLTCLIAIVVACLAVVGPAVAVSQWRMYREVETARIRTQQLLYISDINRSLQDWDDANTGHVGELLSRHIPDDGEADLRGFEWYYLWRKLVESERSTVLQEPSGLHSLAISPNGRLLAAGRSDGVIRLWNLPDRTLNCELRSHTSAVLSLRFSPDGTSLASAGFDPTIRLWKVAEAREVLSFSGSWCVGFSPDGQTLAIRSGASDIVLLQAPFDDELYEIARRMAQTVSFGSGQPVDNLVSDRIRIITNAHDDGIQQLVFSPTDATTLASTSWDGLVRLWDVRTGDCLLTYRNHSARTWALAWSPDGRCIASGDVNGMIRLWHRSGADLAQLSGHEGTVLSLTFLRDGAALASSSTDNTVRIWNTTPGREQACLIGHADEIWSVASTVADRQLLSASTDGHIKSWNIDETLNRDVLTHPRAASSAVFSPDGSVLATACRDGIVRQWNAENGRLLREFTAHARQVNFVKFAEFDGQTLLVTHGSDADGEFRLRLWNPSLGNLLQELEGLAHTEMSHAVAVQGAKIAWQDGSNVHLFDAGRNAEIRVIPISKLVGALVFSPDGRLLAIGLDDVVIVDCITGHRFAELPGHRGEIESLAFSHDSAMIASGSRDMTIRIWKLNPLASNQDPQADLFRVLRGHGGAVAAMSFSPDGRTMFSGAGDRVIRIWDLASGEQRAVLKGHTDVIQSVVFSPDGQTVASASADNTVRLWRTASD